LGIANSIPNAESLQAFRLFRPGFYLGANLFGANLNGSNIQDAIDADLEGFDIEESRDGE
jgi:uncharacterized protein YjbI with pentapeptide repeats